MRFCSAILFLLLLVTTYGVVTITPSAWSTPDLRLAIGAAWFMLVAVWMGLFLIVRDVCDSK